MLNETFYQKRAKVWDRGVTIIIVALLLVPIPFARFKSWPDGRTILVRPVMPWSRFHFCYVTFPGGDPVEEAYQFTWKGKILPGGTTTPMLFVISSAESPLLKWQNNPELVLEEVFQQGDFVQVDTFWQPLLLWPFSMLTSRPA